MKGTNLVLIKENELNIIQTSFCRSIEIWPHWYLRILPIFYKKFLSIYHLLGLSGITLNVLWNKKIAVWFRHYILNDI